MRLIAYQGSVRLSASRDVHEDNEPAGLDQDRTVDSEFAAADPILGQFVEVSRVEVDD